MMNKYSIIIPCYCSSLTIEKVVKNTVNELHKLEIDEFEFVLVNDCSPDSNKTMDVLKQLAIEYDYIKVINLGKNSGQHNAVMAGLNYATGDFILAMDDDGQTNPSQIKYIKEKIDSGYDICYGYYEEKKENLFRRFGSSLNYWTFRILIHKPKWLKTSSFWIIRKYVRDYVIEYTFPSVHLQGVFLRTTDNICCVPIQHFEREIGKSNYTIKKLIKLYTNVVGFSITPLRIVTTLGFLFALFGFGFDLYVLIRKLVNPMFIAGWTSIFGAICFFSGVILVGLGIVGNYIGRLFIGQSKTPQFVVKDVLNYKEKK